tara:strand:+ start:685 stop:915 length:231 start_codon:yes stop_codon:yes gene_type:complete
MPIDPRVTPVKEEISSLELTRSRKSSKGPKVTPLTGMALSAFAKAVIADRDDDHVTAERWLGLAIKEEAKQKAAKA